MVVFKFDHGQNIIRPWCFLNLTMVKFLNGRQIEPKRGWNRTRLAEGVDQFEGVKVPRFGMICVMPRNENVSNGE